MELGNARWNIPRLEFQIFYDITHKLQHSEYTGNTSIKRREILLNLYTAIIEITIIQGVS